MQDEDQHQELPFSEPESEPWRSRQSGNAEQIGCF